MSEKPISIDPETLSAFTDGELAPLEREAVERALERGAPLREQLEELQWTGRALRELPEVPLRPSLKVRCRESFERELGGTPSPRRLSWGWALAMAASLLVGAGAPWWLASRGGGIEPWTYRGEGTLVQTLDDGTRLEIFPETKLGWRVDSDRRIVLLYEGEIDLQVKPGEKPFLVQTPSGEVEVVGTHFRVKVKR